MISPYKVKELVKSSYRLELPHIMKIYDVFHLSLLWKVANDLLSSQQNSPLLPTVVNNKEEWKVNNILDAKYDRGSKKVLFWVKWKEYDNNKAWYDATNFNYTKEIVNNFYKQNLTKSQWENNLLTQWEVTLIPSMEINQKMMSQAQKCHMHKSGKY